MKTSTTEPGRISEYRDVDAATFRDEIVPGYRPAVLRGLVADWPAVRRARTSIQSIGQYLSAFKGGAVDVMMMPPHVHGRLFYSDDMRGFNFSRSKASISEVSDKLLRYAKFEGRPSLAVQSALIADCLPGFANENRLSILDESVQPRIWLGNAVTTPAHFDESNNVACVVSGTRRFTLFPPEQIANLYIGPLGHAPTGTPISLVSLANPDFEQFPRFRDALASALVAELEPGDAIYIPTLWWHHVQSLAKYNMLVNYWWKGQVGATGSTDTALNCLLHCLLTLKQLPAEHRQVWKTIFDHYVFSASAESVEHIPLHVRGVLGEISPELAKQVKAFLVTQLQR
ncbi:MAG TPA: cupin-like domain-containing protein [Casimicrobiaceae bacterium]|jgi:hypothetical protein